MDIPALITKKSSISKILLVRLQLSLVIVRPLTNIHLSSGIELLRVNQMMLTCLPLKIEIKNYSLLLSKKLTIPCNAIQPLQQILRVHFFI